MNYQNGHVNGMKNNNNNNNNTNNNNANNSPTLPKKEWTDNKVYKLASCVSVKNKFDGSKSNIRPENFSNPFLKLQQGNTSGVSVDLLQRFKKFKEHINAAYQYVSNLAKNAFTKLINQVSKFKDIIISDIDDLKRMDYEEINKGQYSKLNNLIKKYKLSFIKDTGFTKLSMNELNDFINFLETVEEKHNKDIEYEFLNNLQITNKSNGGVNKPKGDVVKAKSDVNFDLLDLFNNNNNNNKNNNNNNNNINNKNNGSNHNSGNINHYNNNQKNNDFAFNNNRNIFHDLNMDNNNQPQLNLVNKHSNSNPLDLDKLMGNFGNDLKDHKSNFYGNGNGLQSNSNNEYNSSDKLKKAIAISDFKEMANCPNLSDDKCLRYLNNTNFVIEMAVEQYFKEKYNGTNILKLILVFPDYKEHKLEVNVMSHPDEIMTQVFMLRQDCSNPALYYSNHQRINISHKSKFIGELNLPQNSKIYVKFE